MPRTIGKQVQKLGRTSCDCMYVREICPEHAAEPTVEHKAWLASGRVWGHSRLSRAGLEISFRGEVIELGHTKYTPKSCSNFKLPYVALQRVLLRSAGLNSLCFTPGDAPADCTSTWL